MEKAMSQKEQIPKINSKPLTYISLFSGAGIGCFGLKEQGFHCIATNEILEKRLKIQKFNNKCLYPSGYISGDISTPPVSNQLFTEIDRWKKNHKLVSVDVLIATPPCQGMSVANHKKKNEQKRNSLVVESIKLALEIKPKFLIFENVRAFLKTPCTDIDKKNKTIQEAIDCNLGGTYNLLYDVVNLKNYGANSSRTRTLVLGVRKDLINITPFDIFPDLKKSKRLRQLFKDLPLLSEMGEISKSDIFHSFRKYDKRMVPWIENLREGQSAYSNTETHRIPHQIINGEVVFNKNKNGDKYARWYWDREGPCIHTRNDILSSQNTVHPSENRVFSIREVMLMMTIPNNFNWSSCDTLNLNNFTTFEKQQFLYKEELNIRHCLGESVPTAVLSNIALKIKSRLNSVCFSRSQITSNVNLIFNKGGFYVDKM